jgi:hypothetical protein
MLDMLGVDPRRLEVDADRSCVGCAYNLRTLPIDSRCPECSTPIALSLRPNELEFVDPEWLLKVRGGVFALLVVSIGMVVAMLLGGVGVTGIASCSAMSVIPLLVILYVLFAVGVFRATTTEPSAASETAFDSARMNAGWRPGAVGLLLVCGPPVLRIWSPVLRRSWRTSLLHRCFGLSWR